MHPVSKERLLTDTQASPDAEGATEHVAGRLPVELWTDIASWCSRSSVYRLCLGSSTFYLLFRHLQVPGTVRNLEVVVLM